MSTIAPGSRGRRAALAAAALVLLAGCSAMVAQNPSSPLKPVNAVRHGDEPRLMLGGADVVAYAAAGRYEQGSPRYRSEYEGVSFHFTSAEHQARFDQAPASYLPAYHGYDAMSMVWAVPRPAEASIWARIDGRVFLFADATSKAAFELDARANIAQADRYWHEQVLGHGSDWQRTKRWVEPMPGYKDAEQLQREVAAARKGG